MLITYNKQQEIKPVSINNEEKFTQLVIEVEELELDLLLDTVFYQDVLDNYVPTTSATTSTDLWQDLVEGSTFEDCDGNNIRQKGLWYLLAYLNYASYSQTSHIEDTFTGMVQKTRQDSEPISQGDKKNTNVHFRQVAFNYFEKTRWFLNENSDFFENWHKSKENRVKGLRMKGLKKTRK